MKKKIIAKISEGLGNQLFMYANSYSLSKKYNLDYYIDNLSGYYQSKHIQKFQLDRFQLSAQKASNEYIFDNFDCTFLSQELLYLYKQRYVKYIAHQLDWPLDHTDTRLDDILSEDANAKYVAQAAGKLDEYIISASKNSFRTQ